MPTFSTILDQDWLRELAGDRYFQRGVDYFDRGLVHSLAQYDGQITADVHGTEVYQVSLWLDGDDLQYRCTCPLGVDDLFCKHCVAVGLAWIAEPPPYRPDREAPAQKGTTMEDVRQYLGRQPQETLVNLILNRAMEDSRWREQLLMKAAAKQPEGADINTFRRSLRNAIIPDGFIDYYRARDYADDVQSVVNGLEDLLDKGYANDVIDLCEEAITLFETAYNSIDDSYGHVGYVTDQLQDLHYRACEDGTPDPHDLAHRLFSLEVESGYGFFFKAIEKYCDLLGKDGLKTYGQIVDAEWNSFADIGSSEQRKYN
ncbi:MAG: hypothetical protein F6K09_11675, partial [Merismopedia sp. SIO2A8]|nr:hypothetical protein [Merismopedia sp. SIO2A8]